MCNQLAVILQRPTGQQETGKYYLTGAAYATSAALGAYVGSLSRGSTPAGGVSVDTTDQSPSGCAAPTTDHLTANGFRVSTTATGIGITVVVGGNYTISY